MAIQRDFTKADNIFTGTTLVIQGIVYQSDGVTVQNLTGWTLSWMLKKFISDADANAKLTKTIGSGIVVTSAPAGTYTITLSDTDLTLPAAQYVHELKRTNAGSEAVLTFGTFVLRQAVHQA